MADLSLNKILKNNKYDILTPTGFQHFEGLLCGTNNTIIIKFSDGNKFECTPKQKIYIDKDNYVFAKDLAIGDSVYSIDGEDITVSDICFGSSNSKVYDFLEVSGGHKYLINKVVMKNCLYLDEFAFVKPHIANEFIASVFPTISSGQKTKVIITSTPSGLNHYYKMWEEALGDYSETNEGNGYVRSEIPWNAVPGRDKLWAEREIRKIGQIRFNQEYLCKFIGSVSTLIDHNFLELIKPQNPLIIPKLPEFIKIWELPRKKEELEAKNWEYVASLDSGYGIHSDNTVLQICLVKSNITVHQVAKIASNSMEIETFCKKARFLLKHYHDPELIIEQNGPGIAATKFFHSTIEYENLLHFDPKGRHMGMWATDKIKENACILLKTYIQRKFLKVYDKDTIQELHSFGKLTQKKWGALGGNLDDHITSIYWIPYYLQSPLFHGNIVEVNIKSFVEHDIILNTDEEKSEEDKMLNNIQDPRFHMEELEKGATYLPEEAEYGENEEDESSVEGGNLFFRE